MAVHQAMAWHRRDASVLGDKLVTPEHPQFEHARQAWNLAVDQRPAAVVAAESPADVAAAVSLARQRGLRLSAQGTGHGAAALGSLDDTILVKTRRMRTIEIDSRTGIARLEAGVTWSEAVDAAASSGLALLAGSSPDVGVVGYTLGGGLSWLGRRYGLAANSVHAVELVTAEGEIVRADQDHEPELFWALRGGGGLGAVTHFTYRLHTVGEVLAGVVFHPTDAAAGLLEIFRKVTPSAPAALTAMLVFTTAPPLPFLPPEVHGQRVVVLAYCWSGEPTLGRQISAPLAGWGQPLGRHEGVLPYAAWQQTFDPSAPAGDHYYWTTSQFDRLDDGLIRDLLPRAIAPADPLSEVHVHHLGGAVATVPEGATAFTQRNAAFFINVIGRTAAAGRFPAVRDWTRDLRTALAPYARAGMQPNFISETADLETHAYGTAIRSRLAAVRKHYDPDGLFTSIHGP